MPAKRSNDSKSLKQTTLFDSTIRSSNTKSRKEIRVRPSSEVIKKDAAKSPTSSDDRVIRLGPADALIIMSSDEENDLSLLKSTGKRFIERLASESSRASEEPHPSTSGSQVDEDRSPRKKRRLQRRRSSQDATSNHDEETDDLVDEVDEKDILDSRLRTRNKKSSYQKNLEKLKRRKLKMTTSSENEDASDESVDRQGSTAPFDDAKPSSDLNNLDDEDLDSSEDSAFIVEDDNVFQLPAQFSMESHQDLSHQFKKIFQFFVHIAAQPPKRRSSFMKKKLADDEYFSVPLKTMRRKVLGIRDSLVASSVWKPAFKKKLERYPDFSLTELVSAVPYCDACQLGGRMSTLLGRLRGSRYNPLGFNPSHSDDDDDDEATEYHLGRFCAKRTRVYHEFSHWEIELFQCISGELEELRGSLHGSGFHRVAYFHGIEPPDDLSDANGLCDWLDQRHIIDREWQKLEKLMESAHRVDAHSKNAEDD